MKIELDVHGRGVDKSQIGEIIIVNDGTSDSLNTGNYNVTLMTKHKNPKVWRKCRVENFPRKRLGIYDLLYRALANCVKERN